MELNEYIEHTLLKPNTTTADIKQLCQEALDHNFSAVCVPPFFVKLAANLLDDTPIRVATVVGYPMGYHAIPVKVEEAKRAIDEGADEIEIMINVAAIKDGSWAHVKNDIDSVTTAARLRGKRSKVILEMSLLSKDELKQLCDICTELQVEYVKNATGMNGGGVTMEKVALLKSYSEQFKIIAVGGIHDKEFALQLVERGVFRLGTSSGIELVH